MANSDTNNHIAKYLLSLKLDNESRQRISEVIRNEGTSFQAIKKYATETEIFTKHAHKVLKINGFRHGTQAFKDRAVARILDDLSNENGKNLKFLWDLYENSAIEFIVKDLSHLNKLLSEVQFNPSDTPEDILKLICKNAFYYFVEPKEVSALYEVWHIPRIKNFDEIIKLCETGNEFTRENRIIIKELIRDEERNSAEIKNLQKSIESTVKENESWAEKIKNSIQSAETKAKKVDTVKNEKEFKKIKEEIKSLKIKINNFDTDLKQIRNSLKTLKEEIKSKNIEIDYNEISEKVNKKNQKFKQSIEESVSERIVNAESLVDIKIDNKMKEIKEEVSKLTKENLYVSPLEHTPKLKKVQSYKIVEIPQFLSSWKNKIDQTHINANNQQLLALHLGYMHSPVIIVHDEFLLDTWIETLAWEPFTKNIPVSPTWLRESDWASGAEFLSGASSISPRFLKFRNFDIGLTDSYLFPSLDFWHHSKNNSLKKIFLLPSEEGFHLSKNISNLTSLQYEFDETLLTLRRGTDLRIKSKFIKNPLGLSPKTYQKWAENKMQINIELKQILMSTGVTLSHMIRQQFIVLAEALNYYFDEKDSVVNSARLTLVPWIRINYDEPISLDFLDLLKST